MSTSAPKAPDIADRLALCFSSVIHDVMKDLGVPIRVLPREITGIDSSMRCAGPVFTIRGRPDTSLSKDESLEAWAALLSRIPAEHVAICQPQDDVRALFGGLSAEALKLKGVRGYVVDGGCRDLAAISEQAFPVFARFATPIDIVSAWRAEEFDVPIAIRSSAVLPGDFVLADRDGIILIPGDAIEAVLKAAETKMATEGAMVRAIRAGLDPLEAYRKHRVF